MDKALTTTGQQQQQAQQQQAQQALAHQRCPLPHQMQQLVNEAHGYLAQAKADNTRRAYKADWNDFEAWCRERGLSALPAAPETLAVYLTALARTRKTGTLRRRLSAISQAHRAAAQDSPTSHESVRALWAGIRRAKGLAQQGKAPALVEQVRAMCESLPPDLLGTRDRALLLLGFAGALRRSELVALDVSDLQATAAGLVVTIRRSKTDQEGAGRKVGIPRGTSKQTCPVRSVGAWLQAAGIKEGALFRPISRHGQVRESRLSGQSVALVVKRRAQAAGLEAQRLSGHSLRAGLATSAAMAGASERSIMSQTGHKSVQMVRRYIREGSLFRDNAAASLGL